MGLVYSTRFYMDLVQFTLLYHGSTSLYIALSWLYVTLHYSTSGLLHPTSIYRGGTWLYLTLDNSTMAPLHSTWLYITLPWIYFTLLESTQLYHSSTSLYQTLHYSAMTLLHSTRLYITLPRAGASYFRLVRPCGVNKLGGSGGMPPRKIF